MNAYHTPMIGDNASHLRSCVTQMTAVSRGSFVAWITRGPDLALHQAAYDPTQRKRRTSRFFLDPKKSWAKGIDRNGTQGAIAMPHREQHPSETKKRRTGAGKVASSGTNNSSPHPGRRASEAYRKTNLSICSISDELEEKYEDTPPSTTTPNSTGNSGLLRVSLSHGTSST